MDATKQQPEWDGPKLRPTLIVVYSGSRGTGTRSPMPSGHACRPALAGSLEGTRGESS